MQGQWAEAPFSFHGTRKRNCKVSCGNHGATVTFWMSVFVRKPQKCRKLEMTSSNIKKQCKAVSFHSNELRNSSFMKSQKTGAGVPRREFIRSPASANCFCPPTCGAWISLRVDQAIRSVSVPIKFILSITLYKMNVIWLAYNRLSARLVTYW